MSFFDRSDIPNLLLHKNVKSIAFRNAIGKLIQYCLIIAERGASSYGMHRLIQIVTQHMVNIENEADRWKLEALRMLEKNFPFGEVETWRLCEQLMPHFHALNEHKLGSEQAKGMRAPLLSKKAHYDEENGMWEAVHEGRKEELTIRIELSDNGPGHPKSLEAMHELARAEFQLERVEIAEESVKNVLEQRIKMLGSDHRDTLNTLNNLAFITGDA